MINFGEGIVLGLQSWIKFNGRATRAEFWWFALFYFLLYIGTAIIGSIGLLPFIGSIVGNVVTLGLLIPLISVSVRRLHDIGRMGWWMMVWLGIPLPYMFLFILVETANNMGTSNDTSLMLFFAGVIPLVAAGIGMAVWWTVWFCNKGDRGPNKYGPDPRQAT